MGCCALRRGFRLATWRACSCLCSHSSSACCSERILRVCRAVEDSEEGDLAARCRWRDATRDAARIMRTLRICRDRNDCEEGDLSTRSHACGCLRNSASAPCVRCPPDGSLAGRGGPCSGFCCSC